ncbi:MAG: NADPH2:quinone reductase [Polaribacter sp.]
MFEVVRNGDVSIHINQSFALADCAKAHQDLEASNTTGSTVLVI